MALPSLEAVRRHVGIGGPQDPRGPQGMFSRGANIYRGGMPNAHSGPSPNPNMGRPPTRGGSPEPVGPSLTALVGSLPPNMGNPDQTMNDALMALWKNKQAQNPGVA